MLISAKNVKLKMAKEVKNNFNGLISRMNIAHERIS